MKNLMLFNLILFLSFSVVNSYAQATLSIQGVIKNSDGTAVEDGDYEMTFKLYDGVPAEVWDETQPAVEVKGGVYSVLLGSVAGLPPFTTTNYELGVSIEGGQELQPRSKVTAAPFALALIGDDNIFSGIGNVGIGTTTPTTNLEVNGTVKLGANGLSVNSAGITTFNNNVNLSNQWISGDGESEGISITDEGNVGIGTDTASATLEVNGDSKFGGKLDINGDLDVNRGNASSALTRSLTLSGARNASGAAFGQIDFKNIDDNDDNTEYVGASIRSSNEGGQDEGDLQFFVRDDVSGTVEKRMEIKKDGVYIGAGGGRLENIIGHTLVINLPSIGSNDHETLDFAIPGATVNSTVMVSPSQDLDGGLVIAFARGKLNEVRIRWRNTGSNSQNMGSIGYRIVVINHHN